MGWLLAHRVTQLWSHLQIKTSPQEFEAIILILADEICLYLSIDHDVGINTVRIGVILINHLLIVFTKRSGSGVL